MDFAGYRARFGMHANIGLMHGGPEAFARDRQSPRGRSNEIRSILRPSFLASFLRG